MTSANAPLELTVQEYRQRVHQQRRARGGRDSEALVAALNDACLAAGVAYVHKVPTPYVVRQRLANGAFVGQYSRKAGTDFAGVMLDGTRRRIAMEAKSDVDPAGSVALSELRDVQFDALEAALRAGDVAVLLVVLGSGPRARAHAIPWIEARTHARWDAGALRPFAVRSRVAYLAQFSRRSGT